jgi:hypothetical protein
MSSDDGEGGGGGALTVEAIKALIAEGRTEVRDELKKELEEGAEALQKEAQKAARFEKIIAAQAEQIATLQLAKVEAKVTKVKAYCRYGTDGDGKGNPWPERLVNEPNRDEPHCFDLSEDKTYQNLVGANRGYKYEWRTLASVGSYLHDYQLDAAVVIGDLRAEGVAELSAQADRLENTLAGISDLVASRFALIKELVNADTTAQRKAYLQEKLYPREGVSGPPSSLATWNAQYDTAYQVQLEKQLAVEAARTQAKALSNTGASAGTGTPATGTQRPRPRFNNARAKQ